MLGRCPAVRTLLPWARLHRLHHPRGQTASTWMTSAPSNTQPPRKVFEALPLWATLAPHRPLGRLCLLPCLSRPVSWNTPPPSPGASHHILPGPQGDGKAQGTLACVVGEVRPRSAPITPRSGTRLLAPPLALGAPRTASCTAHPTQARLGSRGEGAQWVHPS